MLENEELHKQMTGAIDPITEAIMEPEDKKEPVVPVVPDKVEPTEPDPLLNKEVEDLRAYKKQIEPALQLIQSDPALLKAVQDKLAGKTSEKIDKVLDIELSSADAETKKAISIIDNVVSQRLAQSESVLTNKLKQALVPIQEQLSANEATAQETKIDKIFDKMDEDHEDWSDYGKEIEEAVAMVDPKKLTTKFVKTVYRGLKAAKEGSTNQKALASPPVGGPSGSPSKEVNSVDAAFALAEQQIASR